MKRILHFSALSVLGLLAATPPATALEADSVRLSVDVTGTVTGNQVDDISVVSIGALSSGLLADMQAAGLPERVEIDALLVDSNLIVFSTDLDVELNSVVYADEDLIAYDAGSDTFASYFDGSAEGIPAAADIDAACLETGSGLLLFSLANSATLAGTLPVHDDDVIRRTGVGTYEIAYSGDSDFGLLPGTDIDALYDEPDTLYFSLTKSASLGGPVGRDEDVWAYDKVSMSLSLVSGIGIEGRADLTSLDVPIDSDLDGLTDYEEISGLDDPASSFEGAPLGPVGSSDPFLADSDGDGFDDYNEALAGTDAQNPNDLLKVTSISRTGDSVTLTWTSKPGKTYGIEAGPDLQSFPVNLGDSFPSEGTSSDTTFDYFDSRAFFRIRVTAP